MITTSVPTDPSDADDFWGRTIPEPNTGCWLWMGKVDHQQYGVHGWGPRRIRAHRAAYALAFGPFAKALLICHKCDVPSCVNPGHLFLGTNADNIADMVRKGRNASGERAGAHLHPETRVNGERHWSAKLTEAIVVEIRKKHATGGNPRLLGLEYGVSRECIGWIVRRQTWKHVK